MLPEKYRRLWRRRLRRRPLLPFLLAATLAVDLALRFLPIDWEQESVGGAVRLGFLANQLGLLGAWITHARRGLLPRMGVCILLLTLALMSMGCLPFRDPDTANGVVEYFELLNSGMIQAIIFTTVFVSIIATGCVQCAYRLFDGRLTSRLNQRFTIASLLWITLIITLLLGFGRYAVWDSFAQFSVVLFVLAEAFVAAAMLAMSKRFPQWPWRHLLLLYAPGAGVVGFAAVFLSTNQTPLLLPLYYTVQFFLYGAWFYLLGTGVPDLQSDEPTESILAHTARPIDLTA